jgi:hypothetical protein
MIGSVRFQAMGHFMTSNLGARSPRINGTCFNALLRK